MEDQSYPTPTHIAYADESSHNIGRYRGIALVTISVADAEKANPTLERILKESSIKEFKWAKLRSARNRFAAQKIVECVFEWAVNRTLRIDAITWDIEDSRHNVPGRSDIRNLRRMYYTLFRNVLGQRWSELCVWELRPDKSSFGAASHLRYLGNPDEMNEDARRVQIAQIKEVSSNSEPLVQVADLFAGLATYSRGSYEAYELWEKHSTTSMSTGVAGLSNADKERCQLINDFYRRCKKGRLGVGLKSSRGLRTRDPHRPLNFWWYEPQGDYDKAPKW